MILFFEMTDRNKIYTSFLIMEMGSYLALAKGLLLASDLPTNWTKATQESTRFLDKLRENGEYFHADAGSVFMDYKLMREKAVPYKKMREIARRFNLGMTED